MSIKKSLSIGLLLLVVAGCPVAGLAQRPAAGQDGYTLYAQHKYAAAAQAFERVIQTSPSARLCYYAALANKASGKELRAKQLFQYIVSTYPRTQEAALSQKALAQAAQAAATASQTVDLPDSVKGALPLGMAGLLNTPMGKRAIEQVMKEHSDQIATIREAEQKGVISKEKVAANIKDTGMSGLTSTDFNSGLHAKDPNHPFSAEDIARDGANGIDQSRYPNCWFEASMSSLAELPRGQRLLSSMIKAKDDKYVVRFPNDGNEYIVSEGELAGSGIRDNAAWASIIECAQVRKFPENKGAEGSDGDQNRLEVGLGCITGRKAEVLKTRGTSVQELSSFIGSAVKSQNPIVCSTYNDAYYSGMPLIIFPLHAYTITSLDPAKNMITLRNPHGHQAQRFGLPSDPHHLEFEDLGNGVFRMSVPTFQKYFYCAARSFI